MTTQKHRLEIEQEPPDVFVLSTIRWMIQTCCTEYCRSQVLVLDEKRGCRNTIGKKGGPQMIQGARKYKTLDDPTFWGKSDEGAMMTIGGCDI